MATTGKPAEILCLEKHDDLQKELEALQPNDVSRKVELEAALKIGWRDARMAALSPQTGKYLETMPAKAVVITEACLRCSKCLVHPYDVKDFKWRTLLPYFFSSFVDYKYPVLNIYIWKKNSACCDSASSRTLPEGARERKWVEFCLNSEYEGTYNDPLLARLMFEAESFGVRRRPREMRGIGREFSSFVDENIKLADGKFSTGVSTAHMPGFSWSPARRQQIRDRLAARV